MWHPHFSEKAKDTAGLFVHFRKSFRIDDQPPGSLPIHITADTRYKLFVNQQLVSFGPVKGDRHLWFYDQVDIGPYLRQGENKVAVLVLRYFYSTAYAPSFPRLPVGGLRVVPADPDSKWADLVAGGSSWETAIDSQRSLRVNDAEDGFLHVYEDFRKGYQSQALDWAPASIMDFRVSTGNSTPWHLSPRLIPMMEGKRVQFQAIHNVKSCISASQWHRVLSSQDQVDRRLILPPQSSHRIDLEASEHTTAFIKLRFLRPSTPGAQLTVTYSECYEDEPHMVPYLRTKGRRDDVTKSLYGPKDYYNFEGTASSCAPSYHDNEPWEEVVAPFHWRTFRFIQLHLTVASSELVFLGIEVETANYPLQVLATVQTPEDATSVQLWETSVRTLKNCMHDCYEDCPFYEQLQYAMDTRSSILFTYYSSGDDRLAKQAITQIHNSFQPMTGLTCSRAPSHRPQIIPHFSLYWILMLADHLSFFDDVKFIKKFLPVADAILEYFDSKLDPSLGLVVTESRPGIWNFVDWAEQWQPYGIPPTAVQTGISTYTNQLYSYVLRQAATVFVAVGKRETAEGYYSRANSIVQAIRDHCFDGELFTDSLASQAVRDRDYSQHCQVWAVLGGCIASKKGQELLRQCLTPGSSFVQTSVSMSFYTLRALSAVGGTVYDELFHDFWNPWRKQLELNVTTWEEDSVSQRSDCHAWGSAPIYEFMAEVAGIRPLGAGWKTISFSPRICLYPDFSATVPLCIAHGQVLGLVKVMWKKNDLTRTTTVSLSFKIKGDKVIPVHIFLPGEHPQTLDSTTDRMFLVKS